MKEDDPFKNVPPLYSARYKLREVLKRKHDANPNEVELDEIIETAQECMSNDARAVWMIWSLEHSRWWAPGENGYVDSRSEAGRYTFCKALEIVFEANRYTDDEPNEAMIRDHDL